MINKRAGSSQAAWALLAEGVSSARLEAHNLRSVVARVLRLVEESEDKEAIYSVAGDLILSVPDLVESLEVDLDRTSYALSVLGKDTLRDSLSSQDRNRVENAVERSAPLAGPRQHLVTEVVEEYLKKADLNPPLGSPGGPCHVIDRIEDKVSNPKTLEVLKDSVEHEATLSDGAVHLLYDPIIVPAPEGIPYKKMKITDHAQFRMDLRSVYLPAVQATIKHFFKQLNIERSRQTYLGTEWTRRIKQPSYGDPPFEWTHPSLKLTVVFRFERDLIVIPTTYWNGVPNPRPPGEGGCDDS